jgi:hypothetical protein
LSISAGHLIKENIHIAIKFTPGTRQKTAYHFENPAF